MMYFVIDYTVKPPLKKKPKNFLTRFPFKMYSSIVLQIIHKAKRKLPPTPNPPTSTEQAQFIKLFLYYSFFSFYKLLSKYITINDKDWQRLLKTTTEQPCLAPLTGNFLSNNKNLNVMFQNRHCFILLHEPKLLIFIVHLSPSPCLHLPSTHPT